MGFIQLWHLIKLEVHPPGLVPHMPPKRPIQNKQFRIIHIKTVSKSFQPSTINNDKHENIIKCYFKTNNPMDIYKEEKGLKIIANKHTIKTTAKYKYAYITKRKSSPPNFRQDHKRKMRRIM